MHDKPPKTIRVSCSSPGKDLVFYYRMRRKREGIRRRPQGESHDQDSHDQDSIDIAKWMDKLRH